GLQVVDGDQRRLLPRHAGLGRVEHVSVRVDQTGQDHGGREIDHARASRYLDLTVGTDGRDLLAVDQDQLLRSDLTCDAVEQPAGANCGYGCRLRTRDDAVVAAKTRLWSRSPPWLPQRASLRTKTNGDQQDEQDVREHLHGAQPTVQNEGRPEGALLTTNYQ